LSIAFSIGAFFLFYLKYFPKTINIVEIQQRQEKEDAFEVSKEQ